MRLRKSIGGATLLSAGLSLRIFLCTALLAIGTCRADDSAKEWSALIAETKALCNAGHYSAAADLFQKELASANHSGVDDRQLLKLHYALADVYYEAGRFAEAESEYRRALALIEKNEGPDSLNYAVVVAGMSVLRTRIDNPGDAVALMFRAIATHRKTGSAQGLAIVRACLAQILRKEKRYQEEESLLLDALADLSEQKTADPNLMAACLNNLAVLRFDQERYEESVDLQQQAIQMFETAWGKQHPSLVAPLNNLAATYVAMGRLNDAQLSYQRALSVCRSTLGEGHLDYAILLKNYALVLRKLGHKSEAQKAKKQGWQIEREVNRRNGVGSTISVTALHTDRKAR